jgi:GNAT superfamily N-acetyltransferase
MLLVQTSPADGQEWRVSPQVRTALAGDIPAMHRIRLAVRENRLTDSGEISEAAYHQYVEAGSAWVAENDNQMVGFAAIEGIDRRVWALFVAPEAEGSGVGRALHEAMLDWARAQSISELCLTTSEATRAERFYRLAGWKRVGSAEDGELRLRRSVPA